MKKTRISPNFIVSVLMTVAVVVFAGFFGDHYFDLNDDVLMKDILSGAYTGTPAGHNIQMLYPISAFIALLYRAAWSFDWYGIFLCTCQYLCVFIVFYRSLKLCSDNLLKVEVGAMELAFMLGAVGAHFLFVQYTFNCGFLSATAIFLIMTGKDSGKRAFILPVLLILLAYLIRSEMLLLTLPMVGVGILSKWWLERLSLQDKQDGSIMVSRAGARKELFTTYVKLCVALVLCLLIGQIAHRAAYSTPDWKDFNRLFDARTELYDFQYIPDYAQNKAFYDGIGLDKSEQQLLINYNFGLDEEINADILRAVASYADKLKTDEIPLMQQLINAVPEYLYRLRHIAAQKSYQYPMSDFPWNIIAGVLYLGTLILYLFGKQKEKRLPVVAMLALLFACRSTLWLYIIVRGRDPVRITHPLYLVEIGILVGMILVGCENYRRNVFIPVVIAALVAAVSVPNQVNIINAEMKDRDSMRQHYGPLYEYFDEHEDSFYFVDVYTGVSVADAIDYEEETFSEKMFENVDNSEANHDLMGGWASKSPLYYKKLMNNGFESMEKALLLDNVYMVQLKGKDTGWLSDYYKDKGKTVAIEQVDLVADVFAVYSVSPQ
ncbi:hypothetical protein [Butyrivibrio sp. FCS014]|uniref:hypothetical protein n=1 Tax=Butyrivibrio sp. FCS014 TaxID=1408304 RepID=UPI0004656E93|nr:hypothetical protein [Butyrivibrio sp. FCS014]